MSAGCRKCGGLGMVLDTDGVEGHGDYRPCPVCRPEQHERFMEGHMASGHDCADCQARRGGAASRSRRGRGRDDEPSRVSMADAPKPDPAEPLPVFSGEIEEPF